MLIKFSVSLSPFNTARTTRTKLVEETRKPEPRQSQSESEPNRKRWARRNQMVIWRFSRPNPMAIQFPNEVPPVTVCGANFRFSDRPNDNKTLRMPESYRSAHRTQSNRHPKWLFIQSSPFQNVDTFQWHFTIPTSPHCGKFTIPYLPHRIKFDSKHYSTNDCGSGLPLFEY